ncbi:MAG: WXG100 family type VII secretion target [Ruminococcaceae bacterium]|nr:WXG100 family type VII secretion target [Oscillospiraceae bacterium]
MIRVSANELIAKANELKNLNAQLKAAIGELEANEETLRTMWEGEANDAFHTAFTNDKIQMTNFYNAIEVYIYRLLEIAAKYQQAEATSKEIASARTYH